MAVANAWASTAQVTGNTMVTLRKKNDPQMTLMERR